MTRRERLERKLENRREWADKATERSRQRFDTAHRIADAIPFGQPILVGHHSERHARRDQERIHSNMSKGCELDSLSKHHDSKADGLEHQLNRSIFSDDTDAVTQLEARIKEREEEAARYKAINREIRKGDGWEQRINPPLTDAERKELLSLARCWSGVYKPGFPPYVLSNLNGRIRADRERLKAIKVRQERQQKADAAPNGITFEETGEYIRVTFAAKPDRTILNSLKAAGFYWSSGSWSGKASQLPESVAALREVVREDTAEKECSLLPDSVKQSPANLQDFQTDGPKAERPAPTGRSEGEAVLSRQAEATSEPGETTASRPTQSTLAIHNLPEAAAEAADTRAQLEGDRLTLRVKNPPPRPLDADRLLAGPLFRGTAASPQDELFKEER